MVTEIDELEDGQAQSASRVAGMFRSLTHRNFRLFWFGALLSNVGTWMQAAAQGTSSAGASLVYVGTYTEAASKGKAEGIYVYQLDPATGGLTRVQTVPRIVNPSFLTLDRTRRYLYSVNEVSKGGVTAFAIGANGTLTLLNTQARSARTPAT